MALAAVGHHAQHGGGFPAGASGEDAPGDGALRGLGRQQHALFQPAVDGGIGQVVEQAHAGVGRLGAGPHHHVVAAVRHGMQVVGTRVAHWLPVRTHAVLRLSGGAQVDGRHQVLRAAEREAHRGRHALAEHLVLAHERAALRKLHLVALVRVQRMRRPHARAPVGHGPAGKGHGEVGGFGARQIDHTRLARTHLAAAAPVDQDAALGFLLLVFLRQLTGLTRRRGLGLGRQQRQALAHAHAGRDGLARLHAGAQTVVQGDVDHARRHDAHGARHAVVGVAAHARTAATDHAHEAAAHGHVHLGHAGHAAGGQVDPQLRLGGLGGLCTGSQAEQAQAGGQHGGTKESA